MVQVLGDAQIVPLGVQKNRGEACEEPEHDRGLVINNECERCVEKYCYGHRVQKQMWSIKTPQDFIENKLLLQVLRPMLLVISCHSYEQEIS